MNKYSSGAFGPNPRRRERGAVLVIGLIFLVMMTILGLTALQASTTAERMAGNAQDLNIAFQAAEASLREAEGFLEQPALPAFDGSNGLYQYSDGNAPEPSIHDPTKSVEYATYEDVRSMGVAANPRYVIEQMEPGHVRGSSLVVGASYGAARRVSYRITAVGYGRSTLTKVALQATFRR